MRSPTTPTVETKGPEMPPAPPLRDSDIPTMTPIDVDEWHGEPEPELSEGERWAKYQTAVTDTAAAILADAEPHLAHPVLELIYRSANAASKAKRALDHPLAANALRTHYGPDVRAHVVWRSGRPEDETKNLRKRALSDPQIQRIIEALGGTLRDVSPHDGEDT